jgi:mercuric ion transport protein
MTDDAHAPPPPAQASPASLLLSVGGLATAFGAAACCGLPMLLAGAGLGTAWIGGIATVAAPHRTLLLILSALFLMGGAAALWRQLLAVRACRVDGACATPAARLLVLAGLLAGAALFVIGYLYV